jgi:predicted 2-oxoglutarate/Fe(II)-dependent dioxygenase YbiX
MLYLTDVDENNGPFEYITKTNKWYSLIDGVINNGLKDNQNRLNDSIINRFLKNKKYNKVSFKAKKGTLIIFNSFGIHRGTPLKEGVRYALTNYYFPDLYINQNLDRLNKKFKIPMI